MNASLNDLIEALQIMRKYGNPNWPTNCEHDVLLMCLEINPDDFSEDDLKRLEELGFDVTDEYGGNSFQSFRFGSC